MNKEETLAFIDKQIAMELKIIEIVKENVEQLGNAFVKDLLIAFHVVPPSSCKVPDVGIRV